MRRFRLALALGLSMVSCAAPALADDARRLSLARELMAGLHEDDAIRSALPLLTAQMRQALAQQGLKSERAEAFVALYQKRLAEDIGRYTDDMAQAYAAAFTEDELAAVLAFDATPAGRKFIAERPALTQASVLAMHRLEQDVAREVWGELERDPAGGAGSGKL